MPPARTPRPSRRTAAAALPAFRRRVPEDVPFLPSMVVQRLKIDPEFEKQLRPGGRLAGLLDNPPLLEASATQEMDGRLVPVVLAVVRNKNGESGPGILVRLLQGTDLRDASHTNARGGVLLRLPARMPEDVGTPVSGTIELLGLTPPFRQSVTIPAGRQHIVVEILLDALPPPQMTLATSTQALSIPIADNPLDRLPGDFPIALCADLNKVLSTTANDPILGSATGSTGFPGTRLPLIKRLTIPRIGDQTAPNVAPQRYLVRVRQEWNFLSYTLGELSEIASLDPGEILKVAERVAEQTQNSAEQVLRESLAVVHGLQQQLSSVDTIVSNTASTANAIAASGLGGGGFGVLAGAGAGAGIGALVGGPIGAVVGGVAGALFGGLFGGGGPLGAAATPVATVTNTIARTTSDTSLLVNSLLQTSQSSVNQAIRTLSSTARSLQRATDQVSPLLSRVTNLVRWTLYENYAVCTKIEEVLEIEAKRITAVIGTNLPLFSDQDIVDYERIFSPRLLEGKLRPHFDTLRRAIAAKNAAIMPVSLVRVWLDYSAAHAGADFTITVPGIAESLRIELRPGTTRAYGFLRAPSPLSVPPSGALGTAALTLSFRSDLADPPVTISFPFPITIPPTNGTVNVGRITLGYESVPGSDNFQEHQFTGMVVTNASGGVTLVSQTVALVVPRAAVFTEFDPLFIHINRNREYYFGLLCQAALAEPSLRDDAPQLAAFDGNSPLWRLPIIGFEGDRALILKSPAAGDPNVTKFKADQGAASLVQLASPGAYSEALQGVLQLTDAIGKLHPALLPVPAPAVPPIALIDLTGKAIPGLPGGTGGTLGGTIIKTIPLSTSALGTAALTGLLGGTGAPQFTIDNARLIALGVDPTKIDRVIGVDVTPIRTLAGAATVIPATPATLSFGSIGSPFSFSGATALVPGSGLTSPAGGILASPVGIWKLQFGSALPATAIPAIADVLMEVLLETHA